MASGDTVLEISREGPPAADAAAPDTAAGGSSPAEVLPVIDFAVSVDEHWDFYGRVSDKYAAGGVIAKIKWKPSSGVTNECRWGAAIRRIDDAGEDFDTAHTYVYTYVDATAPGTLGQFDYVEITIGTMDSLAAGEAFCLRIKREGTHVNDDMAGDAELIDVAGVEV